MHAKFGLLEARIAAGLELTRMPGEGPFLCDVCLEDVPELLSLLCGHGLCRQCWASFANAALREVRCC